jgi:hypothetical protein
MKPILSLAVFAMIVGAAGAAPAHYSEQECRLASRETPISIETMKQKIGDLGYAVDRFATGRSCYEVVIVDRETGGRVNALFDMANGNLVGAEPVE